MLVMFSVMCLVIAVDQGSKALVMTRFREGTGSSGAILGIRLRHISNRRRPWGSPRAVRAMTWVWLGMLVGACAVGAVVQSGAARIALGATLGGATGNLIDGILRRGITDFIDLRVWPVFNLADTAIVLGAMLAFWTAIGMI
jgi:signal peptidase II